MRFFKMYYDAMDEVVDAIYGSGTRKNGFVTVNKILYAIAGTPLLVSMFLTYYFDRCFSRLTRK